jgi:hypothetical protein
MPRGLRAKRNAAWGEQAAFVVGVRANSPLSRRVIILDLGPVYGSRLNAFGAVAYPAGGRFTFVHAAGAPDISVRIKALGAMLAAGLRPSTRKHKDVQT